MYRRQLCSDSYRYFAALSRTTSGHLFSTSMATEAKTMQPGHRSPFFFYFFKKNPDTEVLKGQKTKSEKQKKNKLFQSPEITKAIPSCRIRSLAWKLVLPIELANPLLAAATEIHSRDASRTSNAGAKYILPVQNSVSDEIDPPCKKHRTASIQGLGVYPFVWTPDTAQHRDVAAAATMEVIADAPGQPYWWYEAFFEKLS